MTTIRRHFQFDAAHMLSNYEGKCSNLHGHTYTGDIELQADVLDETGMVLDYNDIKKAVDRFDHAAIFSHAAIRNAAEDALLEWCKHYKKKYVVIAGGKCTAEFIAQTICNDFVNLLSKREERYRVTVWLHETPDSTAKVSASC